MDRSGNDRKRLIPWEYAVTDHPVRELSRCRCGRVSLLPLPCPQCGRLERNPVLERRGRGEDLFRRASLLAVSAAGVMAALLWAAAGSGWAAVICLAAAAAAVLFVAQRIGKRTETDNQLWRFCTDWKSLLRPEAKTIQVIEDAEIESVLDAWYLDMDRLERIALAGDWSTALQGARRLGCVYRNARLSRLEYRALLHLPLDDREAYDLDDICANLTAEDVSEQEILPLLHLICSSAQLNPGEQTFEKKLFRALLNRMWSGNGGAVPDSLPEGEQFELSSVLAFWQEDEFGVPYSEDTEGMPGVLMKLRRTRISGGV